VTELLPPETQIVTVLRDPLERVVSHVKHQMHLEREAGTREVEDDVNGFLANPRNEMFVHTIGNLVLKYFAGREHPDAASDEVGLSLEEAVGNAGRTQFGFVDELAAFKQRLLGGMLRGGTVEPRLPFENRSQDDFGVADLTQRNRDLLREMTELDRVLDGLLRRVLAARIALEDPLRDVTRASPQRGLIASSPSNFPLSS
jgi:hypothetical protein